MCVFPACGAADDPQTALWNVGSLCTPHFAQLKTVFHLPVASPRNLSLTLDFVKICVLLRYNTALCLTQLSGLENEMNAAVVAHLHNLNDPRFQKGGQYLKLSRALEYYEGYCWWPAGRVLLGGLLSAQSFYASGEYGHNKDSGAGSPHGEYSHRLQWHAISRLITNNFTVPFDATTDWRHSPLELFYELTQGVALAGNLWGPLMDSQSNAGWGNPDRVYSDVAGNAAATPKVSGALTRREAKMGGPNAISSSRETEIQNALMAILGPAAPLTALKTKLQKVGNFQTWCQKAALQCYVWEKSGFPNSLLMNADQKLIKQVYDAAVLANPTAFGANKNYKVKSANLLIKTDAPDKGLKINAGRVGTSRIGFNTTQYRFGPNGAEPTQTNRW